MELGVFYCIIKFDDFLALAKLNNIKCL